MILESTMTPVSLSLSSDEGKLISLISEEEE